MKTFDLIRHYHIRPQKKLGQNFLIDENVRVKICDALQVQASQKIIEIGPGLGFLTEALLEENVPVIAIERDPKLYHILTETLAKNNSNLKLIHESILKVPLDSLAGKKKLYVIGNLPYYITTKILFHLIRYNLHITGAIVTVQKEVAERLLALPGSKAYGRLSVSIRFFSDVEKICEIKPGSFYPQPDVRSTVLRMRFRDPRKLPCNCDIFEKVVEALFQERRKTVHNGLCLYRGKHINKTQAKKIFEDCDIDYTKRAEELMMKEFIAITKRIAQEPQDERA